MAKEDGGGRRCSAGGGGLEAEKRLDARGKRSCTACACARARAITTASSCSAEIVDSLC